MFVEVTIMSCEAEHRDFHEILQLFKDFFHAVKSGVKVSVNSFTKANSE